MKKFQNITKKQIEQYGVQALSDRPNSAGAYGGGGFSPLELKLWFDQLATFEANKINEIHNIFSSDEAAEYIAVALHDNGIHDLSQLVAAIKSGALANILELYPTAGSDKRVNLQNAIYDIARLLNDHDHDINEVLKKPPFTEYDPTVPAWAKKPNPPTAVEIGAAPAGWGLGASHGKDVSSTDFNTITQNGWYFFNYGGTNMPDPTLGYSYMFVCGREGALTQYIFQANSALYEGCTHKRTMFNGAWGEWEWINPPMLIGTEYRTSERWQGSPVYTKLINFGILPNATTKSVAHGISGLSNVIQINGTVGYSTLLGSNAIEDFYVDGTNVVIKAREDASGYASFVTLKYTKV